MHTLSVVLLLLPMYPMECPNCRSLSAALRTMNQVVARRMPNRMRELHIQTISC